MSKEKQKQSATKTNTHPEHSGFAFAKDNYKLLLIGVAIVALGMILMIGGASDDPNKFSEEIFGFRRLTLAPVCIMAGYVVVLLAILKKPKE